MFAVGIESGEYPGKKQGQVRANKNKCRNPPERWTSQRSENSAVCKPGSGKVL